MQEFSLHIDVSTTGTLTCQCRKMLSIQIYLSVVNSSIILSVTPVNTGICWIKKSNRAEVEQRSITFIAL